MAGLPVPLAAAALALVLGETAPYYDLGVQSEARGYIQADAPGVTLPTPLGGYRGLSSTGEIEVDPRLGLGVADRSLDVGSWYAPRLLFWAPGLNVLHAAGLAASLRLGPRSGASLQLDGSSGIQDFLRAATRVEPGQAPPTPLQPVPDRLRLRYTSLTATAAYAGPLGRTVQLSLSGAAFRSGGLGPSAEQFLPLQRGVRGGAGVMWFASRRDLLGISATGTASSFSNSDLAGWLEVAGQWRHELLSGKLETPDVVPVRTPGPLRSQAQIWLGLGAARTVGGQGNNLESWQTVPRAEVGASLKLQDPLVGASLALEAAPLIDRVTGAVYERLNVHVAADYKPAPDWAFRASASSGVALEGPQRDERVAAAELRVSWSQIRAWEVFGGLRTFWQAALAGGGPARLESVAAWTGFVGFSVRERERF